MNERYNFNNNNYISKPNLQTEIVPINITDVSPIALPQSTLDVSSLQNLVQFLKSPKADVSFPSISFIPDLVKDVANYAIERRKLKFEHEQFLKKISVLSNALNMQFQTAYTQIMKNTEVQLAQINGNTKVQLKQIKEHYNMQMKKITLEVKLKEQEMDLYYKSLDSQLKEQARRFDKLIAYATIERQKVHKAIQEAEDICQYYRKKLYNGTITSQENRYYIDLLKFRVASINSIATIIPQLAAQIG